MADWLIALVICVVFVCGTIIACVKHLRDWFKDMEDDSKERRKRAS